MLGKLKPMFVMDAESGGNGGGGTPTLQFTQAQLDAMMAERGQRGERSGSTAVLTALGFPTVDDVKAKLAKLADLEAAGKTEAEKLTAQATAAQAERDALKAQLAATTATLETERLSTAIRAEALTAGFLPESVADVIDLALREHRAAIKIGEDGKVTGVGEVIKAVAESRKHWLGRSTQGQRVGTPVPAAGGTQGTRIPAGQVNQGEALKPLAVI